MKKYYISALLLLLLIGGLLVFRSEQPGDSLVIGAVVPLSGPRAQGGEYIRRGLELAKKHSPILIEIRYEDDKYDAKEGVSALTRLQALQIPYYIGSISSTVTKAIARPIQDHGQILITPGSLADDITTIGDGIFMTSVNTSQEIPALARVMISEFGEGNLHLMSVDTDARPVVESILEQKLKQTNITITTRQKFSIQQTDFKTEFVKIKSSWGSKNALFVGSSANVACSILKQARELSVNFDSIFALQAIVNDPSFTKCADAYSSVLSVTFYFDNQTKEWRDYVGEYESVYKEKPENLSAAAYDSLMIISSCVERNGNNSQRVKSCIADTKDYSGASGSFSINEQRYSIREARKNSVNGTKSGQ